MRKAIKTLALVMPILLVAAHLYAKDEKRKIGYVDLFKVFNECNQAKKSEEVLEKKAQKKNEERDGMARAIKKLQEEAELLSEKEKEKKEAIIEDSLKELRNFDRATREELNRERDSVGRDILVEINKNIASYGKEHGFDLILDSRGLFYGDENVDISNEVISELNRKK